MPQDRSFLDHLGERRDGAQSLARRLASLPLDLRARILDTLPPEILGEVTEQWAFQARADQLAPPPHDPDDHYNTWLIWLLLGGRGSGKSRTVSEFAHDRMIEHYLREDMTGRHTAHRVGAGARTASDGRDVLVEGESGLMAVAERRGIEAKYEPSKRRITYRDLNAIVTMFSAEEPDNARGPQYHTVIGDEFAAWDFSITDDVGSNLWSNLLMGLRLQTVVPPQAALATTPKRIPILRELVDDALNPDDLSTVMSTMTTHDNAGNLSRVFIDKVISRYEGTRLYRQEVLGVLLGSDEDTLWSPSDIVAAHRFDGTPSAIPPPARIVVGVDPPGGLSRDHCGIVAVALLSAPLPGTRRKCIAVLADRSRRGSPDQWAREVVSLCREYSTNRVVAEQNQGYEMVRSVIANADDAGDINVELVHAYLDKRLRAEPVAQLYEQRRAVHVDHFPELEDEMGDWTSASTDSPDRLDAMVHAVTDLLPSIHTRPATISSPHQLTIARTRHARQRAVAAAASSSTTSTSPISPTSPTSIPSSVYRRVVPAATTELADVLAHIQDPRHRTRR